MCVVVWALFFYVLRLLSQMCFPRLLMPFDTCLRFVFVFSHHCVSTTPLQNSSWSLVCWLQCSCLKCCATRLNPHFCCLQAACLSFCFLSSTFWGILWRLARGIVLLLNVKWSVGTFENCVKLCLKRMIFYAASYLYGVVKRCHCHTLSIVEYDYYDWSYTVVIWGNQGGCCHKCSVCRNVKQNFIAKFTHIRPSCFFLYSWMRNVVVISIAVPTQESLCTRALY